MVIIKIIKRNTRDNRVRDILLLLVSEKLKNIVHKQKIYAIKMIIKVRIIFHSRLSIVSIYK